MKEKRRAAPQWVFSWRQPRGAWFPKALAFTAVAVGFTFLLTTVRIRVIPPAPWAARKAAVIQVADDADGRTLQIRAREGGPFPSRFDPADWEGTAALENALMAAAGGASAPVRPVLRNFPEDGLPQTPLLASRGEAVLPKHQPIAPNPLPTTELSLVPVLHVRSGLTPGEMPDELPPFPGPLDQALKEVAADPGQFLLHIDASGRVLSSVSLTGQDESGLADWLLAVRFKPDPASPSRWVVVAVGLIIQPTNGTDTR